MSKTNLSIGVMIATLVAVMTLFFLPLPVAQQVEITTIQSGVLEISCMLDGKATMDAQHAIVAPMAGKVVQVYVQSGDSVKAGQLLIRLDTQMEEAALTLLDEQLYRLQQETVSLLQGVELLNVTPGTANGFSNMLQEKDALMASIMGKQIRSASDGTIENIYVKQGDYLETAAMIGAMGSDQQAITALWMAQAGQVPVPGMTGWWCAADGTRLERLVLETIGSPVTENQMIAYPLIFRSTLEKGSVVGKGEKAPICLVLRDDTANAIAPVDALDDAGRLWIVREGRVEAVIPEIEQQNDLYVQVQNELAGLKVILEPDRVQLHEGMVVRTAEGM